MCSSHFNDQYSILYKMTERAGDNGIACFRRISMSLWSPTGSSERSVMLPNNCGLNKTIRLRADVRVDGMCKGCLHPHSRTDSTSVRCHSHHTIWSDISTLVRVNPAKYVSHHCEHVLRSNLASPSPNFGCIDAIAAQNARCYWIEVSWDEVLATSIGYLYR